MKLFISHGGLGGLAEGVYHGVPMVIMPAFGDQHSNAARATRQGYGIQVDWVGLTEEKLRYVTMG